MITDRLTARILGWLLIALALVIDISMFFLTKAESRQRPGFALIVVIPSLPIIGLGAWLLRRASRLPE